MSRIRRQSLEKEMESMNYSTVSAQQRSTTLDLCKAIAALGVVLVHFKLPGVIGELMASIGTSGVVLFFLISGYAANIPGQKAQKVLLRRFSKNLKLLLITLTVYFVLSGVRHGISGDFTAWILRFADPVMLVEAVLLGNFDLISGSVMWYMVAMLYCYLIFWVLAKYDLFRLAYKCLPVLVLLRIGMETYTNSFGAYWRLSGNAIVGGLPMMLLGHYIAYRQEDVLRLNQKRLAGLAIVSILLMFVSVNVRLCGLDVSQIFKISTGALVFMLCLVKADVNRPEVLIRIGRKYSAVIYMAHFMIGHLIKDAMLACGASDILVGWCLPPIAILCSVLFAAMIDALGQK